MPNREQRRAPPAPAPDLGPAARAPGKELRSAVGAPAPAVCTKTTGASSRTERAEPWLASPELMGAFGLPPNAGSDAAAATGVCRASAPADDRETMWRQLIGERSTAVGALARVAAPKGVKLREQPDVAAAHVAVLPFDELVMVERRTEHGWCYVVASSGRIGFCEEPFLALDPPEPGARLHLVAPGESLHKIAARAYPGRFRDGADARLYIHALVEANRGRRGLHVGEVELGSVETLLRSQEEEHTLEIYRGTKVRTGHALWIPSEAFIAALRASGAITSGSTELAKAWHGAKAAASAVLETMRYGAAFAVGLLEGAWRSVADLFAGAAEMVSAVAEVVLRLVQRRFAELCALAAGWVAKLDQVWSSRGQLAEDFLAKWRSDDEWTRGTFQGEVLGWVMTTALLVLLTAGASGLAAAGALGGRGAVALRALTALDALGDVTTYVGAAVRLPARAASIVRSKLGQGAGSAAASAPRAGEAPPMRAAADEGEAPELADWEDLDDEPLDLARAVDAPAPRGHKKRNRPDLERTVRSLDGHDFYVDLRKVSATARHAIRQLEKHGTLQLSKIPVADLPVISKWLNREIAVVRTPYGRLRIVLGTETGIIKESLKEGEVFLLHTHPMAISKRGHFAKDLKKAGRDVEAVIDWNGNLTYYDKRGLKNPTRNDVIEPLLGYRAAFLDADGNVIVTSTVNVRRKDNQTIVEVVQ